jgi:hypothetical protein
MFCGEHKDAIVVWRTYGGKEAHHKQWRVISVEQDTEQHKITGCNSVGSENPTGGVVLSERHIINHGISWLRVPIDWCLHSGNERESSLPLLSCTSRRVHRSHRNYPLLPVLTETLPDP